MTGYPRNQQLVRLGYNTEKFFKRWEFQIHNCLLRNLYLGQAESYMEQLIGLKLEENFVRYIVAVLI